MDSLRAVAIARVVFYHSFSFNWLTYLPAMGVMFGLGGSLMANSLDRAGNTGKGAVKVVRSRLRRLLPVLWFFGAIAIPLMFWHGWTTSDEENPLVPWRLGFWLLPLTDPPGSSWGEGIFTGTLWYLKTYVWFVLLSPFLLPAFRKVPWLIAPLPLLIVFGVEMGLVPAEGPWGGALVDTTTFLAAWLAGFAHHDGMLKRMRWPLVLALAGLVIGLGLYWTFTEHANGETESLALDQTNTGLGLYSLGVMLVLLKFSPKLEWLAKARPLDRLVSVINSRAVTIYLWHTVAIFLATLVAERFVGNLGVVYLLVIVALVIASVFVFGWVEDIAAKRKPELLPGKPKPKPPAAAAGPDAPAPTSPPVSWAPQDRGHQPNGPDRGYQSGGPDRGYQPAGPDRGYQPNGPDRGYQPNGPDRGYQAGRPEHGYQPAGPDRGYQQPPPNYGYQPPAPREPEGGYQPQAAPRPGTVYGRPAGQQGGTVYGRPHGAEPDPRAGFQPDPRQQNHGQAPDPDPYRGRHGPPQQRRHPDDPDGRWDPPDVRRRPEHP